MKLTLSFLSKLGNSTKTNYKSSKVVATMNKLYFRPTLECVWSTGSKDENCHNALNATHLKIFEANIF